MTIARISGPKSAGERTRRETGVSTGLILPAGSPLFMLLTNRRIDRVTTVQDCIGGKILRVFSQKWPVGSVVCSGAIMDPDTEKADVEKKFWIVTGYASWQAAKAMQKKCGPKYAGIALQSGHWHEVISE